MKLKYWQVFLCYMLFAAGFIIIDLPTANFHQYQTNFAIANLFWVIDIWFIVTLQAYIALKFIKSTSLHSPLFKVNMLIPVSVLTIYSVYVIYLTITKAFYNPKFVPGPLKIGDFNYSAYGVVALLIYVAVNFYFINNQYVSGKIKKMPDTIEQQQLKDTYLIPMRRLVRLSVWLFVGVTILTFIIDIIRYTKV